MKPSVRVLIVEDSENDAALLVALLEEAFEVTHTRVQTAPAMRAALSERPWDVIISDYSMPTFSAPKALAVLHETGLDIPIIIVSGTMSEEAAVDSLKAGAADFLVKDRLARLIPAVVRELREACHRRERRLAEQALAETRQRMQLSLEAAGVGTWERDLASGRIEWSPLQEQLHGLRAGEFAGTLDAFVQLIHPDDRKMLFESLKAMSPAEPSARLEYRTIWPDGSVHWMTRLGRTFYDDAGVPIRVAGISIDNTAYRTLEEQFRRAQKLEAIGGLAAGIAHDFNNLLTVIIGFSEMLSERLAGDPQAMTDVDEIKRAATSAAGLTRQLLAFSRQQVIAPTAADLNQILTESYKMLRPLVEENVRIDLQLADHLPLIHVDRGQIEQVLVNLVTNARDAMRDGGVVTIATGSVVADDTFVLTHPEVRPGPYVQWSVSDTGAGMSAEVQSRLFEPFFTTKERGRGTGLGLATVYGIIKQSAGHIWLSSREGAGTTFTIWFPVAKASEVAAAASPRPRAADLHGRETILVVDDESALRALAARVLKRYGYTVLLAAEGKEAQRIAAEHAGPIDVLLTDVVMPGISGRALGEWITKQRAGIKVIYLSGYTDSTIAHHGVLDAGTRFVQKPFTPDVLLRAVREALA